MQPMIPKGNYHLFLPMHREELDIGTTPRPSVPVRIPFISNKSPGSFLIQIMLINHSSSSSLSFKRRSARTDTSSIRRFGRDCNNTLNSGAEGDPPSHAPRQTRGDDGSTRFSGTQTAAKIYVLIARCFPRAAAPLGLAG